MESPFNNNSAKPGDITIVNDKHEVLDVFENNLEVVDENHKDLKPGNFLIINNPNFKITFSCSYINQWVTKRRKNLINKKLKRSRKAHQ